MEFVDLDRLFVPLKRDADAALEWGPHWGRRYGGWLDWQSVLGHWRVALLAEALSGKTKELEHRADALKRDGKPAFFWPIADNSCIRGSATCQTSRSHTARGEGGGSVRWRTQNEPSRRVWAAAS